MPRHRPVVCDLDTKKGGAWLGHLPSRVVPDARDLVEVEVEPLLAVVEMYVHAEEL